MKSSKKLIIVIIWILLLTNVKSLAQTSIKDSSDIKESILNILNNEYSLFINKGTKITSTNDFINFKLIIVGVNEQNIDIRLDTMVMNKTDKFLFNKIISVYISPNYSNPDKDIDKEPCARETEHVTLKNGSVLDVFYEYYCRGANLKNILKNNFNTTEYIFLIKKADAKNYFKKQNELTIK